MQEVNRSASTVRFGVFEVDLRAGELRKQGLKVKLQEQPFQILTLLLERPGEALTRDELQKRLWPADTFVDFDRGLNRAVNRLREALGDDSENPRFIETLPRRGYRFIAPVQSPHVSSILGASHPTNLQLPIVWKRWSISAGIVAATVLLLLGLNVGGIQGLFAPNRADSQIHSLAVLPLDDLSNDPSQEYFADGMTDELITEVAKIRSLRVISRTSVMQYKKVHKSLPVIARELGVDAILEGTVTRTDRKVRITAQLIRAKDDRHLWSEEYERDLSDVLALQGELAQTIADRIQLRLTPQEHASFSTSRSINAEAHEAYLEAEYFRNKGTEENLNKGIAFFQKAIALNPSYAQAYAGLSRSYVSLGIFGFRPSREVYPKAKTAATKALELDDTIAEAHTVLADVKKGYDWDWVGAEAEYQRAIMLNPSYALAHMWYAELLSKIGRHDEAIEEADRARQLDPVSLGSNTVLGMVLYRAGRYDDAIQACRRALELDPDHPSALWFMALSHEQKGDVAQAIEELKTANSMSSAPLYRALLGHAYGLAGDKNKALQLLEDLKSESRIRYVSPVDIAVVYTGLDDHDSAFQWLERAYDERAMRIQELPDPIFKNLRSDPRFTTLIQRLNLPLRLR